MVKQKTRLGLLAGLVGFFSAGIGVGGGAILVPGLIGIGRYDFRRASSLSLATIAPISFVGGLTHIILLEDFFPLRTFAVFLSAGALGIIIGSATMRRIPTRGLTSAFALFLLVVGFKMVTGWHLAAVSLEMMQEYLSMNSNVVMVVFGIIVGIASSMLGVGCGLLIVPFCVLGLGYPMRVAIPFSLVAMFFLTLAGATARFRKGMLDVQAAGWMIPTAFMGAVLGATISSLLPDAALRSAFGMFLLALGIKRATEEFVVLFCRDLPALRKRDHNSASECKPQANITISNAYDYD